MGVFDDDVANALNDLKGIDSTEVVKVTIGTTTVDGIRDVEEDVVGAGEFERKVQRTTVLIKAGGFSSTELVEGATLTLDGVDYVVHDWEPEGVDGRMTAIMVTKKT